MHGKCVRTHTHTHPISFRFSLNGTFPYMELLPLREVIHAFNLVPAFYLFLCGDHRTVDNSGDPHTKIKQLALD